MDAGSQDLTKSTNANAQPFSNSQFKLAKGANLTITQQAAAPVFGSGSTTSQPIASLGTTPAGSSTSPTGPDNSAPVPTPDTSATGSPTSPTTGNWWDNIPGADQAVGYWSGLTTMQQVAAAAAAILIAFFIFHRRKA